MTMLNSANPFAIPVELWQATLVTHASAALLAEPLLEVLPGVVSVQRFIADEAAGHWQIDVIFDGAPDETELNARVEMALAAGGNAPRIEWKLVPVEQKNWVLEVEQRYPPISVGGFFIHASHFDGAFPHGQIPLLVDAGMAFGTGEHATTSGCMIGLRNLYYRGFAPKRVLDMGCGSGILAIAAHKLWPNAQVLGVDLDPIAIEVAVENAAINRCNPRNVRWRAGDGYMHADVARMGPYDLIIANILARPLMRMAKSLKQNLAPGGVGVLSGLLSNQEPMVLSAHRMQGLSLDKSIRQKGWSALLIS
jgi:ribosomal protein L11 methyltransferase